MSSMLNMEEVDAKIATAELTDEEETLVRQLMGEQDFALDEALEAVLSEREPATPEPAAEPTLGEPSPKQLGSLERELDRHEKRVHEIMGGHVAGFVACDTCGGVGLVAPGDPPPSPQHHEWYKACETCEGYGLVLTGSIREGNQSVDCPDCKGRGYLERLDKTQGGGQPSIPAPPGPAPPQTAVVAAEPGGNGNGGAAQESWGVPAWMGDPNLGR